MKKKNKILIIGFMIIMIMSCLIFSNRQEIKTIKSEKQLLNLYESNQYESISFLERMLTLPFSVLLEDNRVYRKYATTDWLVEDSYNSINYVTTSGVEEKDYSKTNIQVEGVDEADIIKTDGDYIYSISEENIIITNVKDPENIKIEAKINSPSAIPNELLLYKNYLIGIFYGKEDGYYHQNTLVKVYDLTRKASPKLVKEFELYEAYYTSRCIEGKLYIFSKGLLRKKDGKIERKYQEDKEIKEISLNNIKYLKKDPSSIQTLIAELDLNSMSKVKVNSFLINIANAYVSKNNIYLLNTKYEDKVNILSLFGYKGVIGYFESVEQNYEDITEIYKFKIEGGVSLQATTKVTGSIVNQYSLDEKDGKLRIALEEEEGTRIAILDENLHLIGETEKVGEGERMYASRFIGDRAYLVTYLNTDPLFVFDLSNPAKPKVMGELEIPGYSTYLHPYDENHLIGIGMDTEQVINRDEDGKISSSWATIKGMKMCLFDVSDILSPKEMAKVTIGDRRTVSAVLTNPKALLFSKDKNLLAIPVNNYEEDFSVKASESSNIEIENFKSPEKESISEGYFVYHIDLENGFQLKGTITHEKTTKKYYEWNPSKLLRGLYIDNNLYTVSENNIKVNDLNTLKEINNLNIKGVEKNEK